MSFLFPKNNRTKRNVPALPSPTMPMNSISLSWKQVNKAVEHETAAATVIAVAADGNTGAPDATSNAGTESPAPAPPGPPSPPPPPPVPALVAALPPK